MAAGGGEGSYCFQDLTLIDSQWMTLGTHWQHRVGSLSVKGAHGMRKKSGGWGMGGHRRSGKGRMGALNLVKTLMYEICKQ